MFKKCKAIAKMQNGHSYGAAACHYKVVYSFLMMSV